MSLDAKRTARTVLQSGVGLAVMLPGIVDASGIPAALPWVAGALAVAGGFARVMALPGVQTILPSWLRTDTPVAPAPVPAAAPATDAPAAPAAQ